MASASRATDADTGAIDASLAMDGVTRVTGDDTAGLTLGAAVVAACRTRGLAARPPWALANQAMTEAVAGRHSAAVVNATGRAAARARPRPTHGGVQLRVGAGVADRRPG